MTVIDTLTCNPQSGAYTYASEVRKALYNLTLVNHACHQWSTSLLYNRITLTNNQIAQLVATLSGTTLRTQSLAKRIHSLRLVMADSAARLRGDNDDLVDVISLLRILAPTLAIQRLFMDTNILTVPVTVYDLHDAISCLASLSELTLLNQEHRETYFFWDLELVEHQYDCLSGLQVLTVGDVTIDDPEGTNFLIPLVNLKELVLIRPWAYRRDTEIGSILAVLFAPHRALQHLTLVLVEGWKASGLGLGLESLTVDDLGLVMAPYLDKVDIFSESEPGTSRSWIEIGDMIGMEHRWIRQAR
ncbi:hypothetical protein FRB95_008672 [Tulasnella sp. JGI-2019a]|nr:hypothetical protein FRB95_008672 [Tulasnella sp. JGI-2019a]